MKLIKEYECDYKPTTEEIELGMKITQVEDCIVILKWFVRYSGWYKIRIKKDTIFEECIKQIPDCYPV